VSWQVSSGGPPPSSPRLAGFAARLEQARVQREPIANLAAESLTWSDAYAVQGLLRDGREQAGDAVCGHKIAITSPARLQAMGLDAPLCGFLCESGAVDDGVVPIHELIAPRIEPEIAFVMKRPLSGERCTVLQVLAATDFVAGAFEIIDSRYVKAPFDPLSAVADNVSSARHVVGGVIRRPHDLDLSLIGMAVAKNAQFVATGTSAAIFGHPAASVAALVRVLSRQGRRLDAGSVVLTGGLVEAFNVAAGDIVSARFAGLGEVSVRFG
jgi:2-oxo-3-hexenedioate decarboxylase